MKLRTALSALLLVLLLSPAPADAGLIWTAPLDYVIARSTHVGLVRWDDQKGYQVEKWYRGAWKGKFAPHGTPSPISRAIRRKFFTGRLRRRRFDEPLRRMIVFLEAHDGRLHFTGLRRRGGGGSAHAAVRPVLADGSMVAFRQIMNPGGPMPTMAERPKLAEFEPYLEQLLEKHRYEAPPGAMPPIPKPSRAAFYEAIGDVLSWYQGGWPTQTPGWWGRMPSRVELLATLDRLEAFIKSNEHRGARVHALDAIMLLAQKTSDGFDHVPEVRMSAAGHLKYVDKEEAAEWLVREARHGSYGVDFVGLGLLAQQLNEATNQRVIAEYEEWVERTEVNKGTGCWSALIRLGHRDLAVAATKKREARLAKEKADGEMGRR